MANAILNTRKMFQRYWNRKYFFSANLHGILVGPIHNIHHTLRQTWCARIYVYKTSIFVYIIIFGARKLRMQCLAHVRRIKWDVGVCVTRIRKSSKFMARLVCTRIYVCAAMYANGESVTKWKCRAHNKAVVGKFRVGWRRVIRDELAPPMAG